MRVRGVRRRDVEGERMLCGSDLQNQIGVVQNVGCAASDLCGRGGRGSEGISHNVAVVRSDRLAFSRVGLLCTVHGVFLQIGHHAVFPQPHATRPDRNRSPERIGYKLKNWENGR